MMTARQPCWNPHVSEPMAKKETPDLTRVTGAESQ